MKRILKVVLPNDLETVLSVIGSYSDVILGTKGSRSLFVTLDNFVKSRMYLVTSVVYVVNRENRKENIGRLTWKVDSDDYFVIESDPVTHRKLWFDSDLDKWCCESLEDRLFFKRSWEFNDIITLIKYE